MAQEPSDAVLYSFSARAFIRPDVVTNLPYAAPAAPDVVPSAKLTITRRFHDARGDLGDETLSSTGGPPSTHAPPRSALRGSSRSSSSAPSARDASPTPPSSVASSEVASTSRESTPTPSSDRLSSRATSREPSVGLQNYSRTYTRPPSTIPTTPSSRVTLRQSSVTPDATSSRASSRQPSAAPDTPSSRASSREPLPHLDEFVARRGPITRSLSRHSLRFEPVPEGASLPEGKGRLASVLDRDDDCSQYKRETWKIPQTDEEKASGERFVTTWFSSAASYSLAAPPPCMTEHPELQLGDVFLHCVTGSAAEPQMWWWIEGSDGGRFWKRVFRGQLRPDDKRRLSTATNKEGSLRPSWVSDTWFQKQEREVKIRKKAKGKQKET